MSKYRLKAFVMVSAVSMIASSIILPRQVLAQQSTTDSSTVSRREDQVQTSAGHHYLNPAERANDALLITEVKSELAKDGVADNQPVAVDCDHGKIRLSGVMGSAEDAQRAGSIAAGAPGVVAVQNQLTWRK